MVNVAISALDINFVYKDNGADKEAFVRFGGTPEVFQCTRVEQPKSRKKLCEVPDTTYLKNPDGVITYINLPVDDVLKGHERDSISMCALTLMAYTKTDDAFNAPSQLLLVPHCLRYRFFTESWNKDDRFFYITSYSSTYNAYSFTNISRLISGLRFLKERGISSISWFLSLSASLIDRLPLMSRKRMESFSASSEFVIRASKWRTSSSSEQLVV